MVFNFIDLRLVWEKNAQKRIGDFLVIKIWLLCPLALNHTNTHTIWSVVGFILLLRVYLPFINIPEIWCLYINMRNTAHHPTYQFEKDRIDEVSAKFIKFMGYHLSITTFYLYSTILLSSLLLYDFWSLLMIFFLPLSGRVPIVIHNNFIMITLYWHQNAHIETCILKLYSEFSVCRESIEIVFGCGQWTIIILIWWRRRLLFPRIHTIIITIILVFDVKLVVIDSFDSIGWPPRTYSTNLDEWIL